jgi:UDP-N-acetylmuramyl pentapeptide phosphotransferase/UDP-N-acetylglucosamine-1-phosphate transferase
MVSPERQRLAVTVGLILVASIAAVVAALYPHPVAVVICTVLVIVSVVFLIWNGYKAPRIVSTVE